MVFSDSKKRHEEYAGPMDLEISIEVYGFYKYVAPTVLGHQKYINRNKPRSIE